MIALCTGKPAFEAIGEQTIVTFPSGTGEAVRVALTRNQLCQLMQLSRTAMTDAFNQPEVEVSPPVAFRRKAKTRA